MKRFITKPNSKIDKLILSVLSILFTMHFSWWIVGQFKDMANDYWWIWFPSIIAYIVVISFGAFCWYGRKYSVEHTLSKLYNELLNLKYNSLIKKAPKLIDKICKATIVPIERRKPLYEHVCNVWTEEGEEIPGFITEKWKRAVVEYRKYEIEND